MTHPPLILASSSKYRLAQLKALGITIQNIPPNIDESAKKNELAPSLAYRLAELKAYTIAQQNPDHIILGCDQVASIDLDGKQQLLGKPGTKEKAVEQLSMCSGQEVNFYTSLSIQWHKKRTLTKVETVKVIFRQLTAAEINSYLEKEQPYDCAGSFKSEGLGVLLFNKIESRDPNTLIGLPIMLLREMLEEFDVNLLSLATS